MSFQDGEKASIQKILNNRDQENIGKRKTNDGNS